MVADRRIPDPAEASRTQQDRFAAEVLARACTERAGLRDVQVSDTELGLQVWARKA